MVVFNSFTGKVRRFVNKLGLPIREIEDGLIIDEPFVAVTYTCGFGEAPEDMLRFLDRNRSMLRGIAASGSRNWPKFAHAADVIAARYHVPVLHRFELAGSPSDVEKFLERVSDLELHRIE
ncbi:class Ib ribonucleoside-diphosphate reductase assembly flavoprotein NrdI [Paenibacillus rhizovicinus]|nr:class Ib ribonucleoside-diphosphate reductase assembly flavoprotein NrdI [Paenibacillus rhizovicinus]